MIKIKVIRYDWCRNQYLISAGRKSGWIWPHELEQMKANFKKDAEPYQEPRPF